MMQGLATGIGSLPHRDAERAVDLIFATCPSLPFWPQLPKRSAKEGMLAQFCEGLPCLRVNEEGVRFDAADKEEELEQFYAKVIDAEENLDSFRISHDFSHGLFAFKKRLAGVDHASIERIKCHITGPFTFASSIKNEKNVALLHDPIFMQVIVKALIMKARWQLRFLSEFPRAIVFIDEPFLSCFGSAYTPINKEEVVRVLTELTEGIKADGALTGIHCCGNTDWSMLTEVEGIDILNVDVYSFLDKFVLYAEALGKFLARGGMICWGVVPTHGGQEVSEVESLVNRIEEGIKVLVRKGIKEELLRNNLLVSPSCGLGTLEVSAAENIFNLLARTCALLRK
ncbi:MAG: hypothetical protein KKC84_07440 [Candidatus Omnitrophica bacterium]|nr:hypothetical protein [Candidatus Omnitrophota bacterium]